MKSGFVFGTKAETLERLRGRVRQARIPDFLYFSKAEWAADRDAVARRLQARFKKARLAVRSSAVSEDTDQHSMAGAFLSKLGVPAHDPAALTDAIEEVIRSMPEAGQNQVIVQEMIDRVTVSGVIMTYDLVHGAPYYCIDYDDESGRTDVVTGGNGVHKGLFVYRYTDPKLIRSPRVARILALVRELESLCGSPALDVEFGITQGGGPVLFQVRRMTLARAWHPVTERRVSRQLESAERIFKDYSANRGPLFGRRTILAVMPDWNPAEIIGPTPRPLAASLYRELITSGVWSEARARMGYHPVVDRDLMVVLNNHPYIDVRHSFNSFLPGGIAPQTGEKLVNAWLDRLEAHPEWHDKVEFEIVPTCVDFSFRENFRERYPHLLNPDQFKAYAAALTAVTRRAMTLTEDNSLVQAEREVERLLRPDTAPAAEGGSQHLFRARDLLGRCRRWGTLPFAVAARHAFIAEALLRSAARRGAISEARMIEFKRSIHTVASDLIHDHAAVEKGLKSRAEFLKKYGHLRPGTYEVTSLRYDERNDLFGERRGELPPAARKPFRLTPPERRALGRLLREAGLDVLTADGLFDYARRAIVAREGVKFHFTKALSDAMAALVRWGEHVGLSREDVSYLEWPAVARLVFQPQMEDAERHCLELAEAGRRQMSGAHAFRLSHIIADKRDIYVARLNRSVPNFIGVGSAQGKALELKVDTLSSSDLGGRIVCIENADPGYDWIFTKSPAALITKFGGANSHMAIRCAELGLPAAIGCGEQIYDRIVSADSIELDCLGKILRPVHA